MVSMVTAATRKVTITASTLAGPTLHPKPNTTTTPAKQLKQVRSYSSQSFLLSFSLNFSSLLNPLLSLTLSSLLARSFLFSPLKPNTSYASVCKCIEVVVMYADDDWLWLMVWYIVFYWLWLTMIYCDWWCDWLCDILCDIWYIVIDGVIDCVIYYVIYWLVQCVMSWRIRRDERWSETTT